jgi:ferredoxin--NADP+ reductase
LTKIKNFVYCGSNSDERRGKLFKILEKEVFSENPRVTMFVIDAPKIAKKAKSGQFIVVRIDDKGERVPLTVADRDPEKGTVTIVFQEVGKTTAQLGRMNQGDYIKDFVGPLGKPTHFEGAKKIVCVGGGVGVAPIHHIAMGIKEEGRELITIIGARTKELLFWEDKLKLLSNELIVCTDDGSYGRKGFVTEPLKELLEKDKSIDLVIAIGPTIMMKFLCKTTEPFGVTTLVSLNPIMVDATGMCGACRVTVGGKTKFVCVDGPEFNGHKVDFDELMQRMALYKEQERQSYEQFLNSCGANCTCS